MCTHCKRVYNHYSQSVVLVNCGHCKECLQDKADARANRIRNSIPVDHINLFVTLTYDNRYLPVIKKSDICAQEDITIWRYASPFKKDAGKRWFPIGSVVIDKLPYGFNANYLRKPKHYFSADYCAVTYFRDIQNFFKRLRENLKHDKLLSDYEKNNIHFKYYACSEYGPTTHRSHAHLCITIHKSCLEAFRRNIVASWPFARKDITQRGIEVSRGCAQYVASYVNCDASIPKIFRDTRLKARHSYSHHYGVDSFEFSAPGILEKINRRDLRYNRPNGMQSDVSSSVLLPKYVINRHFPLFKGFSRISPVALYDVLSRPESVADVSIWTSEGPKTLRVCTKYQPFIDAGFTPDDIHKIVVSLDNHCTRFCNSINAYNKRLHRDVPLFQREDYFMAFMDVWKIYKSNQYKLFLEDAEKNLPYYPYSAHYDNIEDIDNLNVRVDKSVFGSADIAAFSDPNRLPTRVNRFIVQSERYDKLFKRRKVTNQIMAYIGNDV